MADTQTASTPEDVNSGAAHLGLQAATTGDDSREFFNALDKQVNSVLYDESTQTTSEATADNNADASPVSDEVVESKVSDNKDDDGIQQRYSASSREAKRLSGRLKELEPYVPILDAMKEDPNLIAHVKNYFEGGGNAPKSMKEQLQLDEDFAFDSAEAFENPGSDSAKVMGATIDGLVQRRLAEHASKQTSENQRLNKESQFRQKYEMDDDKWSEFQDFAKGTKLDLEYIYYLKNRETRERNIQKNAKQEVSEQMKSVRERPQSLSSSGSSEPIPKSPDDEVFDQLLGGDEINRLFD